MMVQASRQLNFSSFSSDISTKDAEPNPHSRHMYGMHIHVTFTFRWSVAPGDSTSRTCVSIVSGDMADGELTPSGSSRGKNLILAKVSADFETGLPIGISLS